jgi:hypothetical protein
MRLKGHTVIRYMAEVLFAHLGYFSCGAVKALFKF